VLAGGIVQMSAMPIVCSFLFYAFADRSSGARRALLGIVIPTMALPIVFAATSWPLYVSNYADVPQWLHWGAAGLTIVFCVMAVLAASYMAERWHDRETAPDGTADVAGSTDGGRTEPARLVVPSGA
jgi:hypothetical protein